MSDVFVSYKAEDRRRVKSLVDALEADGYAVWWDAQIGGGAAWRQTIEAELNAAKCVLVAWSKKAVGPDGTFVQDEATRAQQRRVYVPILIDKVHLPLGFGEMQALPLVGWRGDRSDPRYLAVLSAVQRIAGTREGAAAAVLPRVSRRQLVAGGAAATVAIAGVGSWVLLRPDSAEAASSIAVLPFANLSGDPAQAYFSDGIAEELRNALARLAGLKVVGRTSSEAVRDDDSQTIARKLGVANILTGSVRQSPSVVRVSAQLIDGTNGIERWSERYDRAPGDSIQIQTDIAENVARALSIALGAAAGATLTVGGTENADAYRLVLQAQEAFRNRSKASGERALFLLDQAIQLDPNYADAHARKAIYLIRHSNASASSKAELEQARSDAVEHANTALRLAPKLPRAHVAMAQVHQSRFELPAALAAYRRAHQLSPGEASLLRGYGVFTARLGNEEESLRLADKSIELDPLDPDSYYNRAGALLDARRYEDALRFMQETRRKNPAFEEDPVIAGRCLLLLGRLGEAQKQFATLEPDAWERILAEAVIMARSGDRAGAERNLTRMGQMYGENASYQLAEIYAQLGDKQRALAALEQAWAIRDGGMLNIRIDPLLDPLRNDPRFEAIVRRMNFPA